MFLRMIYDDALAQAAYLIGCQRSGEAVIIDPQRDVDRYLDLAARHNLRITAAAETHIHADFLSGVRQLCAQDTDITAILPGEGGDDWTHTWPQRDGCACTRVRDNDEFTVGNIHFRVIHTPGHTPEHVAYVVTDRGSGADTPMGVITGDFVFVGDLGRPDLLETAAGHAGTMRDGAEQLARSAERFAHLPEHLQVWPGHGAGSACGKALGAVPS
jgi:hydroxyacylglutathione hydrolase